ncbi:MAG: hypothetical protein GW938_03530 [Leptospira sp.]|jgi:hypothetical protein|nr:hypothetical protein [Leptospira sp.]NCS95664.1 hypothetical protein [Leptospira sp.]
MHWFFGRIIQFVILSICIVRCGTNTDTPVAPFVFLVPVAVPQILTVLPSTSNVKEDLTLDTANLEINPKPDYILKYFITNREPQFVGYNLYITTSTPSVAETITGEYLEEGIPPSFPALPIQSSTEANRVVVKKIRNQIPPPGLIPFQRCQVYTFSMRSFLSTGLISNPSTAVSRCASIAPTLCAAGTGCNPEECTTTACEFPINCPVGTVCNPCNYPGTEEFGCPCPEGVNPPGCYR